MLRDDTKIMKSLLGGERERGKLTKCQTLCLVCNLIHYLIQVMKLRVK